MKKALAFVMAFAMVAGFFAAVGAEEAKAADGVDNGAYYLVGTMNNWTPSTSVAMTRDGSVYTYEYEVAAAGEVAFKVVENQAADWDSFTYTHSNNGENFSKVAGQAGTVRITFDTSLLDTAKWWDASPAVTITGTAFDVELPPLDGYTVAGGFNNWNNNDADTLLTLQDDGTYEGTVTIPAGLASTDLQIITAPGSWTKADVKLDNADAEVTNQPVVALNGEAGTLTIVYDPTTQILTVTGDIRTTLVIEEVFSLVGEEALIGAGLNWNAADTTHVLTETGADTGIYKITLERVAARAAAYEFMILQDAANYEWNYKIVNDEYEIDNGNMAVLVSEISDITFTVTVGTDATTVAVEVVKSPLGAEDVEAMIDELPEVDEVSISDKPAVQAVKDVIAGLDEEVADELDATKAAKVDALLDKIAELEAAAADTANVIVHFKNTNDWAAVNMYAFVEAGTMFGAWPGLAMTEDAENEGWYSAKFEYAEDFTVIFNGGGQQTINIPVDVAEEGKTEVWIEMGPLAEEPDEFGNTNYTFTLATEAPEGYVDGDEPVVEVTLPTAGDDEEAGDETGDDETGDDETGDDETAGDEEDAATAWDDATLKVHVQMPDAEGWDKLGAYLFGTGETFGWSGGSGELTGAWPGVELLPEVNSENGWYAFGGTFADGYYMLIINNFVSDAEAAEGAEKLQAADLEITDGEYWITLALDEETGKYVATTATEAPEDYDGEGLESVVEDPAGDDETGDETGDDETGDDETGDVTDGEDGGVDKDQPATGDNAPIAVVTMIALVAGASAVVIRKRRVA